MPSLKRIDTLDTLCRNVGPMVDFYHGVLGLPFLFPRDGDEDWAAIEAGNLTIYIFETAVGEHPPRRTPINPENPPGFDSFAFEVDDLDTALSDLEGKVDWANTTSGAATADSGVSAKLIGTTMRPDGSSEVTYAGHPLYWYEGDTNAGDTNGEGLTDFGGSWDAVSPAGNAVETDNS